MDPLPQALSKERLESNRCAESKNDFIDSKTQPDTNFEQITARMETGLIATKCNNAADCSTGSVGVLLHMLLSTNEGKKLSLSTFHF